MTAPDRPSWRALFVDLTSMVVLNQLPAPAKISWTRGSSGGPGHASLSFDSIADARTWAQQFRPDRFPLRTEHPATNDWPARVSESHHTAYRGWTLWIQGMDASESVETDEIEQMLAGAL